MRFFFVVATVAIVSLIQIVRGVLESPPRAELRDSLARFAESAEIHQLTQVMEDSNSSFVLAQPKADRPPAPKSPSSEVQDWASRVNKDEYAATIVDLMVLQEEFMSQVKSGTPGENDSAKSKRLMTLLESSPEQTTDALLSLSREMPEHLVLQYGHFMLDLASSVGSPTRVKAKIAISQIEALTRFPENHESFAEVGFWDEKSNTYVGMPDGPTDSLLKRALEILRHPDVPTSEVEYALSNFKSFHAFQLGDDLERLTH